MAPTTTTQTALAVEVIKQYAGPVQVQRRVMVNVPGKHFPQLQAAEQAADYPGTAVEFKVQGAAPIRFAPQGVGRGSYRTGHALYLRV